MWAIQKIDNSGPIQRKNSQNCYKNNYSPDIDSDFLGNIFDKFPQLNQKKSLNTIVII